MLKGEQHYSKKHTMRVLQVPPENPTVVAWQLKCVLNSTTSFVLNPAGFNGLFELDEIADMKKWDFILWPSEPQWDEACILHCQYVVSCSRFNFTVNEVLSS